MNNNVLKNQVQQEAVRAWLSSNKKGTFELSTGVGKTIASLHCLASMPRNDGKVHLFLAETNSREVDLNKDILLYNKLFNINLREHYNIVFKCYQGVYKLENYEFGLIIADEFHNGLSLEYSKFFFNNKYDAIVGLSATIERKIQYELPTGEIITKGDLLDRIAPVCYRYSINQSLSDGIGRELNIYIIEQTLNNVDKTEKAGNPKKPFYQTEQDKYDYLDKRYKKTFFSFAPNKEILMHAAYKWRSTMIYELKSRISQAIMLVNSIPGKTIVFSNSLDAVLKVTPNVVSSKNSDERNDEIRKYFEEDKIKTIGSFKKLRQGANLPKLDNVVLMSYYGQETHIVQQVGRLRKNGNKNGNVIIFVAKNTFEEPILQKILNYIPYKKLKVFNNVEDVIKEIYNEEKSSEYKEQ